MNKFKIIIPRYNDPRWIVFSMFCLYTFISMLTPHFGRNIWQFFAAVIPALILDACFTYYYKRVFFFSLSGLLSSMGVCFLLFSPLIWPFSIAAIFTIASKHLIRYKGNHIFNPNNFGVVVSLFFLSAVVSTTSGRWPNAPGFAMLFIFLGLIATYKVKRIDMALSFIFWFSVFTFVRYKISGSSNMMFFYLPMTGPVFYLFSFFHITDPITSPSTRKERLLFAFILAVIDGILRYNQVLYSPFYALFIATILKQFLPQILPLQDSKKIWIYK